MSSLREIKDRIASVRSTLKITSAMKLVASSKLRKAQNAIEALRPYEENLSDILSSLPGAPAINNQEESREGKTLVVAICSNSSLCGGFNANAIKKTAEVIASEGSSVEVYAIGRKMAEAVKKMDVEMSDEDFSNLIAHPSYESASALSAKIQDAFAEGKYAKVVLVYNHFVSTSTQKATAQTYLPFDMSQFAGKQESSEDYIIEPEASEIRRTLTPQVLALRFYAAILDSCASEHAARTVAMQTATDNANDLLSELTLEYNKGRQQKITSEILDIVGGSSR